MVAAMARNMPFIGDIIPSGGKQTKKQRSRASRGPPPGRRRTDYDEHYDMNGYDDNNDYYDDGYY